MKQSTHTAMRQVEDPHAPVAKSKLAAELHRRMASPGGGKPPGKPKPQEEEGSPPPPLAKRSKRISQAEAPKSAPAAVRGRAEREPVPGEELVPA